MSEVEKMNEAMYERLGEIAKFASNKRVELDPDFKGDKSDETQTRLMLAAFKELRSMVEFYKPSEKAQIESGSFYTPGWLCELAKKLQAQEPIREDSPNSPDSRSEAKAEKNKNLEFYGLKLNRFGGAGLGTKLIGKRVNVDKTVQVFEIEVKRGNLATGARAIVTENGALLFSLVGGKSSFDAVEQMAVSALHRLLKCRADKNKAKRAAAKGRKQG